MNYEVTEENGVTCIKINLKRATVDVVKEFKAFLFDVIDNQQKKKIILDLSSVEFVDSSFLGAVVSGLKKVTSIKGDIKVVELQPPVRAMFELTRLYKVFEIFDNKQDAINSF
ncbi:MAG TPA: STAS domain-containing protein [Ignavibacteria bacterium]|nr:STAS domain-containing protein [Ignavibacteria bacterium]